MNEIYSKFSNIEKKAQEEIINKLPEDTVYSVEWDITEDVYESDYERMIKESERLLESYSGYTKITSVDALGTSLKDIYGYRFFIENLNKKEMLDLVDELIYEGVFDSAGLSHDTVQNLVHVFFEEEWFTIEDYLSYTGQE